jgi:hypothetical protein
MERPKIDFRPARGYTFNNRELNPKISDIRVNLIGLICPDIQRGNNGKHDEGCCN